MIVELISTGAQQVTPGTICSDFFNLIDALVSEGALFAPYVFEDVFPYAANKSNYKEAWAQGTSVQTSKLIVS
jgi:hypothetical protein